MVEVSREDLRQVREAGAPRRRLPCDARELPRGGACYRVVHSPFVCVRAAPSVKAAVLAVAPHGALLHADAERRGWVRLIDDGHGGATRDAWALIDGRELGLGTLLAESQ